MREEPISFYVRRRLGERGVWTSMEDSWGDEDGARGVRNR
jgi:hypothetical protein